MGTQSIQLSRRALEQLRESLNERGIPILKGNTPYELFRVQQEGYKCVAYVSGKLTFSTTSELKRILGKKDTSQKSTEFDLIGGTDEVGKGEWFGPLVVSIAFLTQNQLKSSHRLGIKDSKLLSPTQIRKIATRLHRENIKHFTLAISPPKYNEIYSQYKKDKKTLNDLLAWSHSQVIEKFYTKYKKKKVQVIVDAFDEEKLNKTLKNPPLGWLIDQRTKAESAIPVAIASIIARDRFLKEVKTLEDKFNITLLKRNPSDVPQNLLPKVAKMHFANVKRVFSA